MSQCTNKGMNLGWVLALGMQESIAGIKRQDLTAVFAVPRSVMAPSPWSLLLTGLSAMKSFFIWSKIAAFSLQLIHYLYIENNFRVSQKANCFTIWWAHFQWVYFLLLYGDSLFGILRKVQHLPSRNKPWLWRMQRTYLSDHKRSTWHPLIYQKPEQNDHKNQAEKQKPVGFINHLRWLEW